MGQKLEITKRLQEVLDELESRFKQGQEFTPADVSNIRRSRYNMERLVKAGKLEERIVWGELLGTNYVKERYYKLI